MTVASINPFQPLPPAVGTSYGNIMDAFFSTLSEAEKQAIWVNFLAANNLTDPIPPGSEQLFLTYIQQTLANQQLFVPTFVNDKLSPEEIKKRNIMFGVFNSVLNMLLSLQQTVTVEAQNIAVFAKWQKEYTEMLTRVPTYVGGEGSAVHAIDVNAANPDWSKFTLGYDGISVQDIAKWWANQRAIGGSDSFQISSMISMDVDSNNSGNWTKSYFTVTFSPNSIEVAINNQFSNGTTSGNSLGFVPINVGSTFDQNVANLETAFKNFWNSPPSSFTLQIL
ncbi:MAG: hypothetical protein JSS12_05730, partial [Verrucomicrobia bacterium]|nr:hypothetical protein [Verrucomicrobiota bacterium]